MKEPKVICIAGSMRFYTFMKLDANGLRAQGHTVLAPRRSNRPASELARIQRGRIKASDELLVVTFAGYIGDDTRSEIEYAESVGVIVNYSDHGTRDELGRGK